MSLVAVVRTESDARRHVMKIRLTAGIVRENLPKLVAMIQEAQQFRDDQILGYASWTAYVSDVFSDEPLRLPREERQELVAILAGEGMSTRAIAPIVGVSKSQIASDLNEVSSSGHVPSRVANAAPETNVSPVLSDEPGHVTKLTGSDSVAVNVTPDLPPRVDDWVQPGEIVDGATGEITDTPVTVTETHTVKTVIGLDGKTYPVKSTLPPVPKVKSSMRQQNAEQLAADIGHSIFALVKTTEPAGRQVIIDAWKLGADACTPTARDYVTAGWFRIIARGLNALANEWETR